MRSRGVEARDEPGEPPVRRRSSALVAVSVGILALAGVGFLAIAAREKAKDLAAASARGLDVTSALEQVTAALRDSAAAAARFRESAGDADARAQKDAADRAGRALRELGVLVPDGSLAEVARARLELLAKDALAADTDDVQARREAAGGGNRPELGRLLAERARAAADTLDRGVRQTADSQMADLRAGLLRNLAWLLAVLMVALAAFAGALASLLRSPSAAPNRAVYLSAADAPKVAPPLVQDVLDTLSDAVLVFDAHGTLLASSPSAAATLDLDARGAGAGKRRGPRRGLYLPSDDAPESSVRNPLVRAIAGERVEGVEMSVGPPSDPESRRVILSARPLRDPDGTRRGAAVVLRDITDLKNAEAALEKARAEHDEVVRGHEQAIVAAGAAAIAGEEWRLAAERLQVEEERDRALADRKASETARKAAETSRGRAETDLKKAEAEVAKAGLVLKQSQERLARLFDELPVPLVAVDADRSIRKVNRAAADLLGGSPSDLQGAPFGVRLAAADPKSGARWRIALGPLAGSPVRGGTVAVPDLIEGSAEVVVLFPEPAEVDDATGQRRSREDQQRLSTRGAALATNLRDARQALAALTTRPPVCPTCASDRAARGFWSRVAKAVQEARCAECAGLARKALAARRRPAESGRPAEDSLVGPGGDR